MKARNCLLSWLIPVLLLTGIFCLMVFRTDPFFHYGAPDSERYFYVLNNERSQNNGILKFFDYDAVIIGTSMTQNFQTSELDRLFGVHSVKTPFVGGSYKEMNDNLTVAFQANPNLKTVIRALDYNGMLVDRNRMRSGEFPEYLYDSNPLNDIKYLLNRDVIFSRSYPMLSARVKDGFVPGITSFDDYDRFYRASGLDAATYDGIHDLPKGDPVHLTDEERELLTGNITQNVISLADAHPDVEFYCFITPYSAIWWQMLVADGTIYRQIEAEKCAIELMLECENIHLFSFNLRTDITTDPNNYSDSLHYSEWINSLILKWIRDGSGLLTRDNYQSYLDHELAFYLNFDYLGLNDLPDYENDLYAAALLNQELTGAEPVVFTEDAEAFCSASFQVPNADGYAYLVFYAKPLSSSLPSVTVCGENEEVLAVLYPESVGQEEDWQPYILELRDVTGPVNIVFDSTGTASVFRNPILY